jgi:3-methyladenine DNA glycosylase AlkD
MHPVTDFIEVLTQEFKGVADPNIAVAQEKYMKGKLEYFGLKTPLRREIQKPFLHKDFLPSKKTMELIVRELWRLPQRDYQLVGQELFMKYHKQMEKKDIELIEFMLINNSWWDSVDYISVHILSAYFKKFPGEIKHVCVRWMNKDDFWLHRACLLFQLKWKNDIDTELMSHNIRSLIGSKEFFINKAIGGVLREYSRTNPEWVIDFVDNTELHSLSKREALRLIYN